MYDGATVGVVIPAYNEQGFIGDVIETVPAFVDRIYVVDDCSTDGTWNEIRETLSRIDTPEPNSEGVISLADGAGAKWRDRIVARDARETPGNRTFIAFRHRTNTGVGGAITTGYRNALDDDVDVVAVMSGDGQMDPDILDRIIEPIVCGDSDYAKGNRLRYAEYRREMSGWRTFGNYLLTYLTRVASGYWRMMDPQNGYTAISKNALERVDLETLYEDYGFCNHLLVRLNKRGLRIADIPMRAVYGDETSNIRYKTFIPSLSLLLLQSYIGRLVGGEARGPSTVAQLLGGGSLVGGIVLGVGSVLPPVPTKVSTGGVLALAGLVLFLVGVAIERRDNADLEVRIDPADPPWALDVGPGGTSTSSADESPRREG
jgi:glycosyltransferase involved in cell wall biosynthesis